MLQEQSGNPASAAETYALVVAALPEEPAAAISLARALLADQQFTEANDVLAAAAERMPKDVQIANEQGRLLGARRDYAEALKAYERGLALAPANADLLQGASVAHMRLGENTTALDKAQRWANLDPDNEKAILWLASVQSRTGDTEAAVTTYEALLVRSPDNWLALNNLAMLELENDPARSVKLAEKAVTLSQSQTSTKVSLGHAFIAAGRAEEAVPIFAELSAADAENAMLLYRHGLALVANGETEVGREKLVEALELDPNFPAANEARALLAAIE